MLASAAWLVLISSSSISNSYATDSVNSNNVAGGLAGYNVNSSSIDNSYATGNVSGKVLMSAALPVDNNNSSSIVNSYATGNVSGVSKVGGLVGFKL